MEKQKGMPLVTGYQAFRSYMSGNGFTRLKLSELWDNAQTKQLFNDMTKTMAADPGVTNEHIARAIGRAHGKNMFREGASGDDPPEAKSRPPDDLKSWKEVLEKLGLSAGLAVAFRVCIQRV
jgi:hypothetical protein